MTELLKVTRFMLVLAVLMACVAPTYALPKIGDDEISIGKKAAAEVDRKHAFVDDPAMLEHVQQIGDAIAQVANSIEVDASYGCSSVVPFSYTFKVIDDADVNAFCLPGGHVYLYRGLVELCETDHELAAVIAHEIAHAAHHHMVYLLREQARLHNRMALVLVAGLVGDISAMDMSNLMVGTQYYTIAKVNGYGQQAEHAADLAGMEYMIHAGYNPVGMLTFLEKLADKPDVIDWGIFRTHPRTRERVDVVRNRLLDLGIEINRRAVTTSFDAQVEQVGDGYPVIVARETLYIAAHHDRAHVAAEQLNSLLDDGLQIREIQVHERGITARGRTIVELTDDDIMLSGQPADHLLRQSADVLRRVLLRQMVRDIR